jgi:hypothetical protein
VQLFIVLVWLLIDLKHNYFEQSVEDDVISGVLLTQLPTCLDFVVKIFYMSSALIFLFFLTFGFCPSIVVSPLCPCLVFCPKITIFPIYPCVFLSEYHCLCLVFCVCLCLVFSPKISLLILPISWFCLSTIVFNIFMSVSVITVSPYHLCLFLCLSITAQYFLSGHQWLSILSLPCFCPSITVPQLCQRIVFCLNVTVFP